MPLSFNINHQHSALHLCSDVDWAPPVEVVQCAKSDTLLCLQHRSLFYKGGNWGPESVCHLPQLQPESSLGLWIQPWPFTPGTSHDTITSFLGTEWRSAVLEDTMQCEQSRPQKCICSMITTQWKDRPTNPRWKQTKGNPLQCVNKASFLEWGLEDFFYWSCYNF